MHWQAYPLPFIRHEAHFGRVVRAFAERPPSVTAMLASTVARFPLHEAIVDGERRMTYAELARQCAWIGVRLAEAGVQPGDRVALLCGNSLEFIAALLGVLHAGAIAVPLNVREQRPELTYVLNQCAARAIVFDAELADRLPDAYEAPALCARFAVGDACPQARRFTELLAPEADGARLPEAAQVHEDECAVVLYTSGTTGRPKGAMLTHFNIVHSVLHFVGGMRLDHRDRSLLAVPASHVTGLVAIVLAMVGCGACTLVLREFRGQDFLALAARERMTHTLIVPAMYTLLMRHRDLEAHDLSAWRIGGFGGASMPEGTLRLIAQELPGLTLVNAYGATETTSPTTLMPLGLQPDHLDSVGVVVPCGDVRVMDEHGREVPRGREGEIWIAGPMVVPGYWNDPEANARELCGGYWKSGDIGTVDAEGFVRLLDRRKDLVNRGGYKVYSAEVESVLSLHPDVVEAAILARPDPALGEKTEAIVVPRVADVDAEALRAHCARQLADYKVPDFVTFRAAPLPRNANGKVVKQLLREEYGRR
jgi:O-succinylbenzoic acid--CoA ligase